MLSFTRGDPNRPVGHAFLLFRVPGVTEEVAATYLVVPPIAIDLAKYVPPLIASSLGASGLIAQTSFLPVPPAPERIGLDEVQRLAELRGDDILESGGSGGGDIAGLMLQVAELGDAYAQAYHTGRERAPRPEPAQVSADTLEGMAVLYSMLSERERIEELARRAGMLRYAVEGGDRALEETTRREMRAIGAYLPEKYRAEELVTAAGRSDPSGTRLAQLYIERGYKLSSEDYEGIPSLEEEIALLHGETTGP